MTEQTAVVAWDPNSGTALPAHIANAQGELGTNIADRTTVPSLSYEGKTWAISKDGNKAPLQARNDDGDMVPIPVMRMCVLAYNGDRGRAYYPSVYNPAQSTQPDCWSADGKTPDPSAKNKQSTACNGCPMSVKGSKVQDGKEMIACSSHRMIAIAPAFDIAGDPLRLKIAVTSDWDKEVVEHGWFAFRQYTDYLKSKGITHTGLVVTKAKFDPTTAYPKILFALDRLLSADEVAQVLLAAKSPKVQELLDEKWSAAGTAGTLTDDSDIRPHGLEGAYADGWAAHPDSAGWSYKGQEVVENAVLASRYPEPAPPIPATPPPAAAAPEPAAPAVPASEQIVEHAPVAAAPVLGGLSAAVAAGWAPHPSAPGFHYLGQEVVADADLEARFPNAPAVVPAAPVLAPPAVATPEPVSGLAAALADGWLPHPSAPGFHYKGQEVVADGDLAAKYPPAAATPVAATTAAPAPATSAAVGASPSDPIPDDVQNLLNKWS
jgi:hypothetical protein